MRFCQGNDRCIPRIMMFQQCSSSVAKFLRIIETFSLSPKLLSFPSLRYCTNKINSCSTKKEIPYNEILLTLGTFSLLQTPSERSLSRISQENILKHSRLYSDIFSTTPGVATLGLEPPMALGFIEPVS